MSKKSVRTDQAPVPAGPYSQAIIANGFVFTAGQVAINPATKTLVEGGIQAQARQTLENVKVILEAAGTRLENVVKTTVFLANMSDFAAMNEVYATFFPANPPARSTVGVALPPGILIEIETVAVLE